MTPPWARAAADAAGEETPADATAALRDELQALWSDLDTAIDATIRTSRTRPGAWSMHADGIAVRIIVLSRIAGATPWDQVPTTRLLDGTYQGLLTAAGIEHAAPDNDYLRR